MTKTEIERLNDEAFAAWQQHDAEAFADQFAERFEWRDTTLPVPISDRQGVIDYFNQWMTAFPDSTFVRVNRIVGDDGIAGEFEFDGTNDGPMEMGDKTIPPTHRRVHARSSYLVHYDEHGKIIDLATYDDTVSMLTQLGLLPEV